MKTFKDICAQGDVLICRREALPKGLEPVQPIRGRIIVTHSETGHHHVMDSQAVEMFTTDNPMVAWIKVNRPVALEHLRPHDTHEPIMFAPGVYEVRRQREHTPEGWQQVQD
jgi:hypothetical protein